MSSAVGWGENGKLEYSTCPSEFLSMFDEAMCGKADEAEEANSLEWQWMIGRLSGPRTYEFDVDPDESYDTQDVLDMLEDRGIYPYRQMAQGINAAVHAILKEHPEAKLQEIPVPEDW